MAAIGRVQAQPAQNIAFAVPQDTRVNEAAQGTFQRTKQTLIRAWHATVTGIKIAGGKISFVFFRALEWVNPQWSLRAEVIFLRISSVFQGIKDAWRQQEIQKEIDGLKKQNIDLQQKVHQLDRVTEKNTYLEQTKRVDDQRIHALVQQQEQMVQREEAVVRDRDLVLQEKDLYVVKTKQLQKENEELVQQRNAALAALTVALAGKNQLQQQFNQLQEELTAAQQELALKQNTRELNDHVAHIATLCKMLPRGPLTSLDRDLEQMLPLLRQQMDTARESLTRAKQNLPEESSAHAPLQSLDRILNQLIHCLERVPQTFQLHSNWKQPINVLLEAI